MTDLYSTASSRIGMMYVCSIYTSSGYESNTPYLYIKEALNKSSLSALLVKSG
jgi:hypothetical protein